MPAWKLALSQPRTLQADHDPAQHPAPNTSGTPATADTTGDHTQPTTDDNAPESAYDPARDTGTDTRPGTAPGTRPDTGDDTARDTRDNTARVAPHGPLLLELDVTTILRTADDARRLAGVMDAMAASHAEVVHDWNLRCELDDVAVTVEILRTVLQSCRPAPPHHLGVTFCQPRDTQTDAVRATARAGAVLRDIRFDAEAAGTPLAVNPVVCGTLLSPGECRDLIDGANSWAVQALIDVPDIEHHRSDPVSLITALGTRTSCIRLPQQGLTVSKAGRLFSWEAALESVSFRGTVVLTGHGGQP